MFAVMVLFTLSTAISCREETEAVPKTGYTVTKVTDQKVIDDILSMVDGTEQNGTGRTKIISPKVVLPSGYNYNNLYQVSIPGANWTTYVAYSLTQNTAKNKKMIGIYYDANGVFKNYMPVEWVHAFYRYQWTYRFPESTTAKYQIALLLHEPGEEKFGVPNYLHPPSSCGQTVINCVISFYSSYGWLSVGLTYLSFFQPEVGVGVVGGCMLHCAINGPTLG